MTEHDWCADVIRSALAAVRDNDIPATLAAVARVAQEGPALLRTAVWQLACTDAELLLTLTGETDDPDDSVVFGLSLLGQDGAAVDVDLLEPALRAAVRVLLSLVNGRTEDAETHLDVLATAGTDDLGVALVHLLMWTVQLVDLRDGPHRTPVPAQRPSTQCPTTQAVEPTGPAVSS